MRLGTLLPGVMRFELPRRADSAFARAIGGGEGEDPPDVEDSSMSNLAQHAHRLHPPEHLFVSFPLALTDLIARMSRGATIDRAATSPLLILRHVQIAMRTR